MEIPLLKLKEEVKILELDDLMFEGGDNKDIDFFYLEHYF